MEINHSDVLVVGAGPVGLFQLFELGLLGFKNVPIVDILPQPGGQCIELYPDKPIYDIPGLPEVTGRQLTENLMKQAAPFTPNYLMGLKVSSFEKDGDQHYLVGLSDNTFWRVRAMIIAAGLGVFTPNPLIALGSKEHEGTRLHYSVKDANLFKEKSLLILGGGDSALDWANYYAAVPNTFVYLMHRRPEFRAHPDSLNTMRLNEQESNLVFQVGQVKELKFDQDTEQLNVFVAANDGGVRILPPVDHVLCFFGLNPELGPIREWGLDMFKKRSINVDTEKFETSTPGVYAVGDINYYPGKKKLILSGFHEAALAAFAIAKRLSGKEAMLEYTTTSPKMHERLQVSPNLEDLC
jgi:thioredoxin reductase (NADPH)